MICELILYGAGKRCSTLCKLLKNTSIKIVAIVDNNPDKWNSFVEGYYISSPDIMPNFPNAYLCITIANKHVVEIIKKDLRQRYPHILNNEIHYHKLLLKIYVDNKKIEHILLNHAIYEHKNLSVLFDCYNGLGLGGVEAWTLDTCKGLLEEGEKNIFIISDKGNYQIPYELKKHILYADIDHTERYSMCSVLNLINIILSSLPCKIVTCTVNEIMLASYLLKRHYPNLIEIISVIHNGNENVYEEYLDFKDCPDFYICVSKDIKRNLVQRGINSKILYTITCPFPCEKTLVRKYNKNISYPIRIGYAGRLDGMKYSQKRMDLLLAFIKLLEERGVVFEMKIAGDGPARNEMLKFISLNGLDKKVKFLGTIKRNELSAFWKHCDICVNFSDYEGRSLSIIEAMGNGAVPIVTATSGVKEDITDGVNGYIVPLGDYFKMVERTEYLSLHREKLSQMGKAAHNIVYPKSLSKPHLEFWKRILFNK